MSGLLLIRHGATAWTEAGRIQGRADIPLSAAGRAQVESWRIPAAFREWRMVSSPLARARETALILSGRWPARESRLIEMDWGEWEGETLAALRAKLGPEMAAREAQGLDFQPPRGESPRMVQTRLRPWLVEIVGADTIAICHKGVIRALYALARDWPMIGKPPDRMHGGHAHLLAVAGEGRIALDRINIPLC